MVALHFTAISKVHLTRTAVCRKITAFLSIPLSFWTSPQTTQSHAVEVHKVNADAPHQYA